jgi:hypothetical protein
LERKRRKRRSLFDWDALKIEFMASDCPTTQAFIKKKKIPWNGNSAHKTTGWIREKQQQSKAIVKEVIKENEERIIEESTQRITSSIVTILKRQATIADLALTRIENMLRDNRHVYGVVGGHKIVGELNPSHILSLSRAAQSASELQCKAEGIENESGTDEGSKLAVQQELLDRIREVKESRSAD